MSDQQGTSQNPMVLGSQKSQRSSKGNVTSRDLDNLVAGLLNPRSARQPTVDPSHRPGQPRRPFPPPLTNANPLTYRPNPDEPIQTACQQKMLHAFQAEGRWGLVEAVYEEAKNKRSMTTKGATWEYLIDDYEQGDHHMFQLACMLPDEVIVSLIRNTLPSDYKSNSSQVLRSFVDHEMNPTSQYAGIYLNITTRAGKFGFLPLPTTTRMMGKWLSSNEVAHMLDRVQRYMENKQADESENTALENCFNKNTPEITATHTRKFLKKEDRLSEWVAEMRRLYCTNIAPADSDKLFLRCPSEVGYTANIPKRLSEHASNSSITPIFGLVNAITAQPASRGGFDFPTPWGVVLWPLWERDTTLARVAESFGTVLCSSYWYEGGFNFMEAGNSDITGMTPGYDESVWSNSIKAAGKRIAGMLLDVERTRTSTSDAQVDCLLRLQKSLANRDQQQTNADDGAKKLADARLLLQEQESKNRDLAHEVELERQDIESMKGYIQVGYVQDLLKAKDKVKKILDKGKSEVRDIQVYESIIWLITCSCYRRLIR